MKYNVWFIIEKEDEENEIYEDLKDTQKLLKTFNSLEKAREFVYNMNV